VLMTFRINTQNEDKSCRQRSAPQILITASTRTHQLAASDRMTEMLKTL
jgi:hypothetical protein